jgi:hypothetical protein
MRALVIAALFCGCSRDHGVRPDGLSVPIPETSAVTSADACERMRATWRLREVVGLTSESVVTFEMIELETGEMVSTVGEESPRSLRVKFRVLSRTADVCRLGFQGGATLVVRPFQPQELETESDGVVFHWVRVTEPLPSMK